MSFFDDTKNVGLMMFIIAILNLVIALVQIADGATRDEETLKKAGFVIIGIGSLIAAFIFFKFGNGVRTGSVSGKLDVVAGFVTTVGIMTIVKGIFEIVGGACINTNYLAGGIVELIFGLIVFYCGKRINDGKTTGFDNVLWILLVIIFFLLMLASLVYLAGGLILIVKGICSFIMYLCILSFMFDKEVKSAML